jgi:CRISPR/Cas system-associated endonuclease Cas1
LLNIGFTFLYRYLMLMIRQVGLSPAIGFLHVSRAGHATLASDLQEPFRHLIDRAVIQATHELRPRDFQQVQHGPFKLRIMPQAARSFQEILHRGLRQPCLANGETEPRAYCWHWLATARSLKRHLKEDAAFRPFEHP